MVLKTAVQRGVVQIYLFGALLREEMKYNVLGQYSISLKSLTGMPM